MTAITIEHLTRRFGKPPRMRSGEPAEVVAVDAVDLRIESGELFFLLGPSGCGKTTLLRMIAGFLEPDAGRIRFGDRDVSALPANRRQVGMVFQNYALWPHMTVYENVAFGLNVRKIRGSEQRARVEQALATVKMQGLEGRRPAELSGGQQQRVALARALVIEPAVLLLDEPLSNLDARLRLDLREEIKRICRSSGTGQSQSITTIYVTHDQKEALSMADRIAVMKDGKVVQGGSPQELYAEPRSRFVADFLGEVNFLPAKVVQCSAERVVLETPVGRLTSSDVRWPSLKESEQVVCAFRPESMQRVTSASQPNTVTGRCVESVYFGSLVMRIVELKDGLLVRAYESDATDTRKQDEQVSYTINTDSVTIVPDEDR